MRTFLQMLGQSVALSTILLSSAVNAQNAPVAAPAGGAVDIIVHSAVLVDDTPDVPVAPFVRVHVVDAQGVKTFVHETSVFLLPNSTYPSWNTGAMGVFLPASGSLELEVRDSNRSSDMTIAPATSENIGWVIVAISSRGKLTKSLTQGGNTVPGELTFTMSAVEIYGHCSVRIVKADGLLNRDASFFRPGDSDPFVVLNYIHQNEETKLKVFSTGKIENTQDPIWTVEDHNALKADVFLPKTGKLQFAAWDQDGFFSSSAQELGYAHVDIAQIAAGSSSVIGTHALPLDTQGTLTVEISDVQAMAPVVNIHVVSGTGLRDVDNNSHNGDGTESDPFVNMYVDRNDNGAYEKTWLYTTHRIQNSRNPTWTKAMGQAARVVLPSRGSGAGMLEFEIQDALPNSRVGHHYLGWVKIDMAKILARDPSVIGTHTYRVSHEDGTIPEPNAVEVFHVLCSNTCVRANDGVCQDGGVASTASSCPHGTDCQDCGARTETNVGASLGNLTISIEPVAFFQPCGSGKYFVSTSMACIDCAQGSTPVAVSGADATTCRCDSATQTWNAATNLCNDLPTPAPPVTPIPTIAGTPPPNPSGSTPVPNTSGQASSDGSSKCEWWCWLLIALAALSLCGLLAFCVAYNRMAKKEDPKDDQFHDRNVVVEQPADQGTARGSAALPVQVYDDSAIDL